MASVSSLSPMAEEIYMSCEVLRPIGTNHVCCGMPSGTPTTVALSTNMLYCFTYSILWRTSKTLWAVAACCFGKLVEMALRSAALAWRLS